MSVARRLSVLAVTLAAAGALVLALSARAAVPVPACQASQLHLRFLGEQGATGGRFYSFAFQNSGSRCTIKGYPKLVLLGKHGHVVAAKAAHWTGTHATLISVGHHKRAFFTVRYLDSAFCSTKAVVAYKFKLFAPGAASGTVFNVVPANYGPASMCRRTLEVSPLSVGTAPFAADAAATPICAASALRIDAVGGQGFPGHTEIVLGLRNVTAHTCHLKGYPGVAALDAHAAVLHPTASRRPGFSKPTIVLYTWQRAFFQVVYTDGGPCIPHTVTAYGLQVIPPGDAGHLVYYLGRTSLCAPPSLTVTPVSHSSAP